MISWIYKWVVIVGGAFLAVLTALVYGFTKGSASGKAKIEVKTSEEITKEVVKAQNVGAQIQKLPENQAGKVLEKDWTRAN